MSTLTEFTLDSTDQKSKLHVCRWLPDGGDVKAVLQIAHGIAEHIGRYDEFGRFMADNGFAVVGNSHLGHGRSAGRDEDRGFFADKSGWDAAVDDMHKLFEKTRAEYPGLPYFLLGHSMGSFLTRTMLIKYRDGLSGCIISGTGQQTDALLNLGLALAGIEKRLYGGRKQSPRLNLLCFGAYNRRIKPLRTPCDWLSRDQDIVDKFIADEACGFVPTVGIFSDMLGGIKFVGKKSNVDKMRKDLPVLLISGDQDPVGDYGAGVEKVYRLFKEAGVRDVAMALYKGARHEVLNETNRPEVYADILRWIGDRMQGSSKKDG
ncbi:Lysophospholipase, alpha-beta hydrolase superfamily [Sporobacter termitidis DSM 10068]|uniref:Lysophospholipase, alpha-beta hydrolase superfamily n=1 Tax=Sporobacter termitidis DSM 10068 TaxID=1123282 RepID=A0A1M5YFJ2_9FIRM|nr:alpha/beta hydrolase [Sporobacter termitidis]SHI10815.1 Lysophospholipase, alpha-beta hydrolase superfamily [Sporobacter termitidis DSM 10068]